VDAVGKNGIDSRGIADPDFQQRQDDIDGGADQRNPYRFLQLTF
jgi:hypothetical protein